MPKSRFNLSALCSRWSKSLRRSNSLPVRCEPTAARHLAENWLSLFATRSCEQLAPAFELLANLGQARSAGHAPLRQRPRHVENSARVLAKIRMHGSEFSQRQFVELFAARFGQGDDRAHDVMRL